MKGIQEASPATCKRKSIILAEEQIEESSWSSTKIILENALEEGWPKMSI